MFTLQVDSGVPVGLGAHVTPPDLRVMFAGSQHGTLLQQALDDSNRRTTPASNVLDVEQQVQRDADARCTAQGDPLMTSTEVSKLQTVGLFYKPYFSPPRDDASALADITRFAPPTAQTSAPPSSSAPTLPTTRPTTTRPTSEPAPVATSTSLNSVVRAATPINPDPYFGAHPNIYFTTPSGNIGCYIFDEDTNYVECTISTYDFDQPGPDCPLGATIDIDSAGRATYSGCATYPPYADRVLPYGASLTNGDMTCASTTTNVACIDAATGSGFFLSRKSFTPVR